MLIHELAHSFVAQWRGLEAKSITLFIFGGVSNLSGDAKNASTEFLVAIVGPLMSFALAAITFGLASVVAGAARLARAQLPVLHQPDARNLQPHPRLPA